MVLLLLCLCVLFHLPRTHSWLRVIAAHQRERLFTLGCKFLSSDICESFHRLFSLHPPIPETLWTVLGIARRCRRIKGIYLDDPRFCSLSAAAAVSAAASAARGEQVFFAKHVCGPGRHTSTAARRLFGLPNSHYIQFQTKFLRVIYALRHLPRDNRKTSALEDKCFPRCFFSIRRRLTREALTFLRREMWRCGTLGPRGYDKRLLTG